MCSIIYRAAECGNVCTNRQPVDSCYHFGSRLHETLGREEGRGWGANNNDVEAERPWFLKNAPLCYGRQIRHVDICRIGVSVTIRMEPVIIYD